jgi:hypothetical protein
MGWKLNARTTIAFLSCYMSLGLNKTSPEDCSSESDVGEIDFRIENEIKKFVDFVALEPRLKDTATSLLSSSIIFIARRNAKCATIWTRRCHDITSHEESDLHSTITTIDSLYGDSSTNRATAAVVAQSSLVLGDIQSPPIEVFLIEGTISNEKTQAASPASIASAADFEGGGSSDDLGDHILRITPGVKSD